MKRLGALVRYGLVSLVCAALYNVIMIAGDRLGLHYAASYAIAFVVVVITGFSLHAFFTLKVEPSWAAFGRYLVAMAMNAPLNLALIFVLSDLAHLPMVVVSPASTVALVAWNAAATWWSLRRRPRQASEV
jgi:putative flippase GtrA